MRAEAENIAVRFNHLTGEIDAAFHEMAQKFGLSDSVMSILYTLCYSGDCCLLNEICKQSCMPKQTINSALRKLERENVIFLEAYGNRQKRVRLTEHGKTLCRRTVLQVIKIEDDIYDEWLPEEREKYIELTQRYLSTLRRKIETLGGNDEYSAF